MLTISCSPARESKKTMKTPIRTNVLILIIASYVAVLAIFISMAAGQMTATEAYEVVKGPLMALIGGSLAIAKDLIPIADPNFPPPTPPQGSTSEVGGSPENTVDEKRNTEQHQGEDKT